MLHICRYIDHRSNPCAGDARRAQLAAGFDSARQTFDEQVDHQVLSSGALLLALGVVGVVAGAGHVGHASDPWPIVPGLVVAGVGLSLLVIPLVNVVLAAVPHEAAGGAGGMFSTAQQLGGALGVAIVGSVFFTHLDDHSYTASFEYAAPVVIGLFLVAGVLSLALPRTAVGEEAVAEV